MGVFLGIVIGILCGGGLGFLIGRQSQTASDSGLSSDKLDQALKDNRLELSTGLKNTTDSINKQFTQLQTVISNALKELREDNHKQLDRMRQTVDERLQSTLEKRLSESFKLVDQKLETVHKSMGEMKALAADVGELQNTLTGVKTRGVWGEAHLGNLLDEVLNAEQYEKEFRSNPASSDKVEFALKIPAENGEVLYLPIDAKFPLTRFEALQQAISSTDKKAINHARKGLEAEIKNQAKKINKYINPPSTTDFAVMYLPLESLYAEIAQNTALVEEIRRKYKITLAGPSTILPMLAMLNLGYRSLMIQKHISEVWQTLVETQSEFTKFGDLIAKAKKKLDEASKVIDDAGSKTRTIENKFKKVQGIEMPKD
ncbi:MAG: DNA recombination protein RmuC [Candidatus Saccharibacteria bacterium]|nr:DNA recombination protein RmuC [Candidatus Saccharibacteria bacterium]